MLVVFLSAAADDTGEIVIGMEGWEFAPDVVTIPVGATVTWLNDDDTTHDLAFPGEHVGLPTTAKPHKVRQTETYAVTFDLPGTYEYVCKRHLDYDMKGSVIVE
jgi:OOP family OmpA-OmpF porin